MALILAAVIVLTALIVTPGWLFYFDVTPKLAVLLAGAALAVLWRPSRRVPRWFPGLLLLNFVSLSISTALSGNAALSAFGTNWRRFGLVTQGTILLFAWLVAVHAAGRARLILRGVAAAAVVASLYGIAQYCGWDPLLPSAAYHIGEGIWTIVRPPSTLGYVTYFANWLVCATYLSLALAAIETSAAWRRVAVAAAVLSVAAMLLTGTRAAILGLAAGAVVWLYGSGFRITRRMTAVAALCLAAAAGFYFSPAGWQLRSRAHWFVEDPWGGARPHLWRDSLQMAAARLPFGHGPEVFTAAFPQFESKALAEAYPEFAHESPHNMFLDALISQGLPGLAILCALCALSLKKTLDRRNVSGLPRAAPAIGAAIAAAIVSQQFAVFIIPTAVIFYTAMALAVALPGGAAEEPRQARFTVVAAPVAMALLYLAARFTLADHALALAQHGLQSAGVKTAAASFAQYERWRLPGTSADLWYSRTLLEFVRKSTDPHTRLAVFPESIAAALRATRAAEDPFDAWYHLAGLYAVEGNAAAAENSLRAAISASPNWFKPHWTLAQLLRLEGRIEDAAREAALAAELDGGKNPEVAQTLREVQEQNALFHK